MAATYNKFQDFSQQLIRGTTHQFSSHVFKIALTNTAPSPTDVSWLPGTTAPPPAAANGYTPGVTTITEADVSGSTAVQGTQVVFTASGGSIGPFRYAILYNDSSSTKAVIAWWDYGSSITIDDAEKFTVQFSGSSPGTIFFLV